MLIYLILIKHKCKPDHGHLANIHLLMVKQKNYKNKLQIQTTKATPLFERGVKQGGYSTVTLFARLRG